MSAEGILYLDTTFNLTNAFVVVLVLQLYTVKVKETKNLCIVRGPVVATQHKSFASYDLLPAFLKEEITGLDGCNIRLVTDSEREPLIGWKDSQVLTTSSHIIWNYKNPLF